MSSSEIDPSLTFVLRVRGRSDRRLLSSDEITPSGLQTVVCDWLEAEGASAERVAEAREWVGDRAGLLRFVMSGRCISLLEDESAMPILWLDCDERDSPTRVKPSPSRAM